MAEETLTAPAPAEGEEWTFKDTPLGMVSAYSTTDLPFCQGHMWPPQAADGPAVFYENAPETYSESPTNFYQWWQNVSEWHKGAQPK